MPRTYADPDLGREDMPPMPRWMEFQGRDAIAFDGDTWPGMTVPRTLSGGNPWEHYTYDTFPIFNPETKATTDCIFPTHFSEQSRQIVAAKYLKKCENKDNVPDFRVLVRRVVDTIIKWGNQSGYYTSDQDALAHQNELIYLLVGQFFAFNSPVWFNIGIPDIAQQTSACFILPVEDSMESIAEWAVNESRIFKRGSGAGADVSRLRSSRENLSLGGKSSGPVSFMQPLDAFAGSIKSGGVTRRAAKMVVMRHDHPDILTNDDGTPGFIRCKADAEKQAHALIDAGYPAMFNAPGNAYSRSAFQNANHSVRASDKFMTDADAGAPYWTAYVKSGEACEMHNAREVLNEIAEATWLCGDPGMQFDDIINRWNTCAESFYIRASNPCLSRGSRLYTSQGYLKVEDLAGQPNVKIFDGISFVDGKVWKTGVKPLVRLTTQDGRSLDVTSDHRIYTSDGWVEANNCLGKSVPFSLPSVKPSLSDALPVGVMGRSGARYGRSSQALMQALGFLQGDGTLRCDTDIVSIYYTPGKDTDFVLGEVVPVFSDIAANAGEYGYTPSQMAHTTGFNFCRAKLCNWLRANGWDDRALPERELPEFIWGASQAGQRAFLRGLFGANGVVLNASRQAVELIAVSFKMLQQVQMLLQTIGIHSEIQEHAPESDVEWGNGTYTSKQSFRLEIERQDAVARFNRLIGFPQHSQQEKLNSIVRTDRLTPNSARAGGDYWSEVVSVERLDGEHDVYDFSVHTTHMGVVNGVVAHNCSEYVSRDDTSCNLASIRITKFYDFEKREFKTEEFCSAVRTIILAMEILVGGSDYPTENIAYWTRIYRNLGIGLADLGALLMSMGVPYDSDEGRAIAATISSLMTAQAYRTSHDIALFCGGAFADYERNTVAMSEVMVMHEKAHNNQSVDKRFEVAHSVASTLWRTNSLSSGFRNANVSVHAPTGTISFLMGCDTTGIEPGIGLVSYKSLVGGGTMKLVNGCVEQALKSLGHYDPDMRADILRRIAETGDAETSGISEHDLPVFDCAFPASPGGRSISWKGHVDMLAALQPTISMAISKTVNMPETATVEEIADAYMYAWKKGVKCVAIYRDNCKRSQPLSATDKSGSDHSPEPVLSGSDHSHRRRLPDERASITHKFSLGGHEGYVTVGMYDDGTPGELFVTMSKEGSTVGGLIDAFATSISMNLQYGVPIRKLVDKFKHMRFEPSGWTGSDLVPVATSIVDYIFKWLEIRFCEPEALLTYEAVQTENGKPFTIELGPGSPFFKQTAMTGPECTVCFTMTQPAGKCYVCPSCGTTTGCS